MSDELDLPPPEELRALYRDLRPPPLADELEAADERTVAAVRWMQGAWRELEPPRASAPPARVRPRRAPRRWIAAAAAAVLLLAAAALWTARRRAAPGARPERVARTDGGEHVEVVDVRSDRIELRSGPVRLLLLDPPTSEPSDETSRPRS